MNFSEALKKLAEYKCVRRINWSDDKLFVYKEVPCKIEKDVIPNMQSIPDSAKRIISEYILSKNKDSTRYFSSKQEKYVAKLMKR